jgi:UDP-N-acetylmuramoyl-tripeptide--D-alanyl-D-alanine ligase
MVADVLLRTRRGDAHAVVEIGISRPRQMAVYARMVRPDIAVVTCIGTDHHQSMGDLTVTRREKCRLVSALPSSGVAVLNGDDPNVMWMAGRTQARVVTYGFGEGCDVRALEAAVDWPAGTRLRIRASGREWTVTVRLLGRHSACAALAGLAVAIAEGLDPDEALERLSELPPTTERMEPLTLANGAAAVLDSLKGSLESFHTALTTLGEIEAPRRIAVLGEIEGVPGKRGPAYRDLGRRAAESAHVLVTVSANDSRYSSGAKRAGMEAESIIRSAHHAREALADLRALVRPGDVVLIKGRGSQRLGRLGLALAGRDVRCWIDPCTASCIRCVDCPMLERGWADVPFIL